MAESRRAARRTRSIRSGNVVLDNGDGTVNVQLPGSGTRIITVSQSRFFPVGQGQSASLSFNGSQIQVMAPSAFGGGAGAPSL